jgi:hypothetical protein
LTVHIKYDPNRCRRILDPENSIGYTTRMAAGRGLPVPDVIFIRDDAWSLGAYDANEREAFAMWRDSWATFARKADGYIVRPMSEYGGAA